MVTEITQEVSEAQICTARLGVDLAGTKAQIFTARLGVDLAVKKPPLAAEEEARNGVVVLLSLAYAFSF